LWSPRRRPTLAGQLLVLQLAVVAAVLVVVAVISVRQSTQTFAEERGTQMRSVAEYLANVPVVRAYADRPDAARRLAPAVDRALSLSGARVVSIAGADGVVVASSDPTRVGVPAQLGDSRVLEGRGWTGDVEVDGDELVAGHAPVLADDGGLAGLTVAEDAYPTRWQQLTGAAPDLLLFLGVGALLGLTGSWLLYRLLERRTHGMRPAEITTLADHREALLHSIAEGVVAVGRDGRVTMVNDSARDLLGLTADPRDIVGRRVVDLGLEPQVAQMLLPDREWRDAVMVVGERVVVVNQRAAASRGEGIGTVTTMRDRTELASIQSRLSSNLSVTDTLRAQTHEFANQLHTISGLVQLEEYDEVVALVGELTRRRTDLTEHVTSRVADRAVAALVIAKASVADEAGVRLTLLPDSLLGPLPQDLAADLTTVVGNLVDNAVDACRAEPAPHVEVLLTQDADRLTVRVRDNGPGVPAELAEAVFVRGVSTKPATAGGRGIGLPLVSLVCSRRGGTVTMRRDDGCTVFEVTLPVEAAA
jgi:sensor histidine kinase regulating citrate/malate metabolism